MITLNLKDVEIIYKTPLVTIVKDKDDNYFVSTMKEPTNTLFMPCDKLFANMIIGVPLPPHTQTNDLQPYYYPKPPFHITCER